MLTRRQDDEAIGWVIRLKHGSAEDWEAFTAWLEADPANLAAYEAAELADADAGMLSPAAAVPEIPQDVSAERAAPRLPRRMLFGTAVAAGIALFGAWISIDAGDVYSIETRPGESRTIALDDGSRIEINGASRVTLDRDRPRYAALDRGEALFRIVHDETRPFEVDAGESVLRDLGTVFNVVRSDRVLEVAVSEGAVLFEPEGEKKILQPGMAISKAAGEPARVTRVAPDAVGAWRDGRLVYAGADASRIAADLSRNLGVPVTVAGSRPFSGVIVLDGSDQEVLGRTAALLGLRLARQGEGWTMQTGTGAPR
ncbi:DUF4880 domain-containing protein [Sphingomonas parva]|uniref:DUF4880 domain-containing protein n=1 Tax=Sphingomonas parva TaxID=2555898 RepID=A0A4Y8ZSX6_9SPHN|nr:FecR domain-containing protein [Sphingomonas parva]TFI58597.1 DUF4880 domain-containing protein [Sphingomonas parva]